MSPDEPVLTLEDQPNKKNVHRVRVASAVSMAAAIRLAGISTKGSLRQSPAVRQI